MTHAPTSVAVAAAVAHHREAAGLTVDELSRALIELDHSLSGDDVQGIERRARAVTVDDLMALAVALGVTPTDLLAHVPADLPDPEEAQLATGVPDDVVAPQLRAWMEGRVGLGRESRISYWRDESERLGVLRAHRQDQHEAAVAELDDLGELALREADALPVMRLRARIDEGERDRGLMDRAEALVASRLDALRAVER